MPPFSDSLRHSPTWCRRQPLRWTQVVLSMESTPARSARSILSTVPMRPTWHDSPLSWANSAYRPIVASFHSIVPPTKMVETWPGTANPKTLSGVIPS